MHCSKKLLGSGDEAYFNEKGPVNMRVDGTAHFAESLPGPRDVDEYQPSPWFCLNGRQAGAFITASPV
jgi:hypothetical protein